MVNWNSLGPRVTITREDGTSRVLPLERLDGGDYLDIAQSPDEGFPPPLAIGPPEQRTDLRTRQHILRDWRRGMGEDEYDEATGSSSFRTSRADTRFKNVLVCRPLATQLGSTVGTALGGRIVYVGNGTAKWFYYGTTATAEYYNTSTSLWTSVALTNGSAHLTRGIGALYYIHSSFGAISYSTDAITWASVSVADINGEFGVTEVRGLAVHDHKLFTLAYNNAGGYTLCQCANPASGSADWSFLGTLVLDVSEEIRQLFVWKFPPQPERGGLFCLTNHGIWWYDDTADAASVTAWKQWHKWDLPYPTYYGYGHAIVHAATGDLYVMPHIDQDSLWQFTGSTITQHSPNKRGGLPPSRQGSIVWSASSGRAIVSWMTAGNSIGVGNKGQTVVFNDQEGWHHIQDDISGSATVIGGGVGPTSVVTIYSDGTTREQDLFDSSELPQYATTTRAYTPTSLDHHTAKMDLGNPTIYKAALYHEMNAVIPTGASVAVYYRLDADITVNFTFLATATDATAIPWRVGFPANTKFRQAELLYYLTRGTATSATPIIYSSILHTTLLPPPRFNTVFRVDLRDETYRALTKTVRGYGLRALRTFIRECHGQMLTFTIHHPGDAITVARGQAAITPVENPLTTLGRYTVQVRDLTTPASGA